MVTELIKTPRLAGVKFFQIFNGVKNLKKEWLIQTVMTPEMAKSSERSDLKILLELTLTFWKVLRIY
jgi:hypothetical protein